MAIVRVKDEPDGDGRKPIIMYSRNPDLVERAKDDDNAHEVADSELDKPTLNEGDKAKPWLTSDGHVEWEIERAPDVDGALDAMEEALSRGRVRAILRDYPDVLSALARGRIDRAWEGLRDAHDAGDLSDDDLQALVDAAAAHNVPVPEDLEGGDD